MGMSFLRRRGRSRILTAAASVAAIAALTLTGCSAKSSTSASAGSNAKCGVMPTNAPVDPDGAVKSLPASVQSSYTNFPYTVLKSAFATFKKQSLPIKVGYTSLPLINQWGKDALAAAKALTAQYAAQGLVEGDLQTALLPDPTTMTPAQQIQLYQGLVSNGDKLIFVVPLSGEAMANAVTAAGKKGVVTVSINTFIPSAYSLNVEMNSYPLGLQPAAEAMKYLKGTGNVLYVGGIPGETTEQVTNQGAKALLANCPNMKLVGTVYGNYSVSGAKAAVLKFLASHPGKIDLVIQPGTMGPGILSAFIDSGRDVPIVTATGAQAGELAYWLQHKSSYTNFGTGSNSTQLATIAYRAGLQAVLGQGPIANDIVFEPPYITNANVASFTPSGATLNSSLQPLGTPDQLLSQSSLNSYFAKPAAIAK